MHNVGAEKMPRLIFDLRNPSALRRDKMKDRIQKEVKLKVHITAAEIEVAIHCWLAGQAEEISSRDSIHVRFDFDETEERLVGAAVEIIKEESP